MEATGSHELGYACGLNMCIAVGRFPKYVFGNLDNTGLGSDGVCPPILLEFFKVGWPKSSVAILRFVGNY